MVEEHKCTRSYSETAVKLMQEVNNVSSDGNISLLLTPGILAVYLETVSKHFFMDDISGRFDVCDNFVPVTINRNFFAPSGMSYLLDICGHPCCVAV